MKNFLFSLLLFAVISEISVSQTYEELQDIFYFTSKKLDAARDSIGILELKTNVQDSIINNQKRIISNDSLINTNNEQIINTLKEQLGLTASYSFNDPAITKQTIIEGTVYDLTGTFRFDVMDKGSLSGSVGIPLRNEKFYVKVCAEWKVF
jgi:hypothetical protein